MIEKLNANNNYIYHIDKDLNSVHDIQDRIWFDICEPCIRNRSATYTVIVDNDSDKIVETFSKSFDVFIYLQRLIKEGCRGFLTGEKKLHIRSIEIADDLSNLEMIVAYLRTLPTNRFDVYTRLIYKGKILISALKINHILPVIKDFEEKYACKNEASFDNLPSADVGEEYEINLIKDMFKKEELDEILKNKEEV
jgi:hypothetical protein